jgi:methylated-DNA-[protein]-cysteine S-methyltransferase
MINSNEPLFAALTHDETPTMSRLHDQLVAAADADRLLDVAYRTVDSPVGTLLLAATDQGLVRVAYQLEDHDRVLQTLSQRVSPRILLAPRRLDQVARQLAEYFAGERRDFVLPLDFRLAHGFRREVLGRLVMIDYGRTETYSQVAAATGHPGAVRAVGSACATNPLPVIVPCHRVLRSDGRLGGYVAGLETKATLLSLEAGRQPDTNSAPHTNFAPR